MPTLAHAEADTDLPAFTPATVFTQFRRAGLLALFLLVAAVLGDYYPSLHLSRADPWNDQVTAGGELVSVSMLGILIIQWIRPSERETRRVDRALDRAAAEEAARARRDAAKITSGTVKIGGTPSPRTGTE